VSIKFPQSPKIKAILVYLVFTIILETKPEDAVAETEDVLVGRVFRILKLV
jgi:hypothetical protein